MEAWRQLLTVGSSRVVALKDMLPFSSVVYTPKALNGG